MGNIGSSVSAARRGHGSRRRHNYPPPPQPQQPAQPEISANRYVVTTVGPYQHPGYNPPPPEAMPLPYPYDHHHRGVVQAQAHHHHQQQAVVRMGQGQAHGNWVGGRYPCGPAPPYVEHQMAVAIRNDVNLKKESLRIEPDDENPGKFLVAFTFDATVSGSITIIFFAKEEDCNLTPMKENQIGPVMVHFPQGLGQKFRQPSGTGVDLSMFDETELVKVGDMDIYPLAVKAEASSVAPNGSDGNPGSGTMNSQITLAVFKKEKGEFQTRVAKQILCVNGMRYELQEIYGIGNSVDGDLDGNDPGKECVICLSEPRDTTVLPCRHMCMCSGCAKVLRSQTNRCPICRQPVERLLEIRVNNGSEE